VNATPALPVTESQAQARVNPLPTQATVVVHLPAKANLYVDGQKANLASGTRSFVTPELQVGRDYYYTVKAELTGDGETKAQSRRILVRAGNVTEVDLNGLKPVDVLTTKVDGVLTTKVDGLRVPVVQR